MAVWHSYEFSSASNNLACVNIVLGPSQQRASLVTCYELVTISIRRQTDGGEWVLKLLVCNGYWIATDALYVDDVNCYDGIIILTFKINLGKIS